MKWKILLVGLIVLQTTTCAKGRHADASNKVNQFLNREPLSSISLPITDSSIALTCFSPLSTDAIIHGFYDNLGDTPTARRFMEKTGITIEYIHPPRGRETEKFDLLIASGDLTDVVSHYFNSYNGGIEAAIEDDLIVDISGLVEIYAPNFVQKVLNDPEARKLAYNDTGTLTGFGAYYSLEYGYDEGLPHYGPMVRKDLLDKFGLEMPITIDDWTNMLRTFKRNGVAVPLAWGQSGWDLFRKSHAFASAFNTAAYGFFQVSGDVKFAPMEPGFRRYLELLHGWYAEGLIDPNFLTHTATDHGIPMFMEGKAGAAFFHIYLLNRVWPKIQDSGYDMQTARLPVLYEGQSLFISDDYGFFGGSNLNKSITVKNEHVAETIMMFDWLYSDEGQMLTNWGIEGESYTLVDGQPELTEKLKRDLYRLNVVYCPNELNQLGDKEHDLIQYPLEQQQDAWRLWRDKVSADWRLPPGISYTPEESIRKTEIMTEIDTYVEEMFLRFIVGDTPLSNFPTYVERIHSLGIQEVIDIQNTAIHRLSRR